MLPLVAWRALELMKATGVDEAWVGGELYGRGECERTLGVEEDEGALQAALLVLPAVLEAALDRVLCDAVAAAAVEAGYRGTEDLTGVALQALQEAAAGRLAQWRRRAKGLTFDGPRATL